MPPLISIIREVSRHVGATVSEGEFRGDRVAVKCFTSEAAFKRERDALSAVGSTDAPVPALLWSGFHKDVPTIVQSWIEGVPGLQAFQKSRGQDRIKLVEVAGTTHAAMCRALLEAPALDLGLLARRTSWPQLLASQVEKWAARISPATLRMLGGSRALADLLTRVLEAPTDLNTLVHCDYLFRNLIIRSSDTAVVIDFGAALVGDPRYDLAKIVWRDLDGPQGELSACFQRRWIELTGIAVPPQLLSTYVACHSVAAIAWVEKQAASDSSDRDFRDLALATYASEASRWL